ncbi:hypothetical protein PoB_002330200 [Plakobranchus ocellatus]|uniref:Uncharacterized protein n=1 Tax=Plakobranchus ocellatus TaxID=259542 RepID=A0AAV3ZNL1_9GAST|nr:hypothetical protein PoB_002330200 [Plakobranchus ocellatus]
MTGSSSIAILTESSFTSPDLYQNAPRREMTDEPGQPTKPAGSWSVYLPLAPSFLLPFTSSIRASVTFVCLWLKRSYNGKRKLASSPIPMFS